MAIFETAIISFSSSWDTTSTDKERTMDLIFVAATVLFFVIAIAYVRACEKLR